MRLAQRTAAQAICLLCRWSHKAPRARKNRKDKTETELTPEEQAQALEKALLAHLRDIHDRLLIVREEQVNKDGVSKFIYRGRWGHNKVV